MTSPTGIRVGWTRVGDGALRRDVAWELLRTLLPRPSALITNECARCGRDHGPIRIHDAGVVGGVSYAGEYAIACVVAGGKAAALGIDAELADDDRRDAAGLHGIVRPGETASVREWTRVEAVLKADGRGLRVDPAAVAVTLLGPGSSKRSDPDWSATVDDSDRAFVGWDVLGPPGVVVSVAIEPVSAGEA